MKRIRKFFGTPHSIHWTIWDCLVVVLLLLGVLKLVEMFL